jgi:Polyketide cyclase / dehydrase and lipid transport
MPNVSAEVWVPLSPERAFAVSQTTGEVRLRWDRFIRTQHFLHGATAPAKGVQTFTHSRLGPKMVSEYLSYSPPTSVGMRMVNGPWFFASFAGGWRFNPDGEGTRAIWRYTFSIRPSWLQLVADPVGTWLLGREIRRRLAGYAKGCVDPVVVAAVDATLDGP